MSLPWPAWDKRLLALRDQLGPETTAFRWFDSAELTVDHFAGLAVVSAYRETTPDEEHSLANQLLACPGTDSVYLKRRPREARRTANEARAAVAPETPMAGAPVETREAMENGARFEIRPANGLSVGLYLDSREARAWVHRQARQRTVLNLFAYTCGFGLAALRGGATRAVNIDLSRKVLDWGEANYARNGLSADRRDFISGDTFEWLRRLSKKPDRFDLVILDPPGFSTTRDGRFTAARDYADLVAQAREVLAPGGTLLCMCNVEALTTAAFDAMIARGFAGTAFRVTERFGASAVDYQTPSTLKCVVVQSLRS